MSVSMCVSRRLKVEWSQNLNSGTPIGEAGIPRAILAVVPNTHSPGYYF